MRTDSSIDYLANTSCAITAARVVHEKRLAGLLCMLASWLATTSLLSSGVLAQTSSTPAPLPLNVERVTTGLTRPVFGTFAPGDSTKMYVVEQRLSANGAATDSGRIRVLDLTTNTVSPTPFLTVPGLATGNEQGLLGLTFHPDYQSNGKFYVNYTSKTPGAANTTSVTRIVEYQATSSTLANAASARPILSIQQPAFSNHKGGWLAFGPDRNLYIATGDGGSQNDPGNRGQDITDNLLGKMLRINVDGDDFTADLERNYSIPATNPFAGPVTGDDEIWAYGLRNPWRNSFDRATGDLYIADVGQNRWEEVNVQPAASTGGENYGWVIREGAHNFDQSAGNALPSAINPILDYGHSAGLGGSDTGFSITGGYVYRGPIAELQGKYFYADYISERIWSAEWNGVTPTGATTNLYNNLWEWTNNVQMLNGNFTIDNIVSFAEDFNGNMYIFDLGNAQAGAGEIFRIVSVPEPSSALLLGLGSMALLRRRRR